MRCFILIFIVSFNLYEHSLAKSLEKRETNFSRSILDQVYAVKPFCPETMKFLWDGFYWNPCWNRCEHKDGSVSESKWEPFYGDINHQSCVIPEQRWKVLSILLKLQVNGSGSEEQCVIVSDLFRNCHRSNTYKF